MSRVKLIKNVIRASMRFLPNQLTIYRLWANQGHRWTRMPDGFHQFPAAMDGLSGLWLSHETCCQPRVILYLHGGGYALCSNQTHAGLAAQLGLAAQAQVFMLEYRLAPEHPYPAALDDAVEAYRSLLSRGVKPEQIVLAGDSAGGGLSIATAMRLRDEGDPQPAGVVAISPWLDLTCTWSACSPRRAEDPLLEPHRIDFFARQYAGSHDRQTPGISPFFGDLRNLPPMLIQVGGDEVLACEALHFSRRAESEGAEVQLQVWDGMFHVWHFASRYLYEAREALKSAGAFIQTYAPVFSREHSQPGEAAVWRKTG